MTSQAKSSSTANLADEKAPAPNDTSSLKTSKPEEPSATEKIYVLALFGSAVDETVPQLVQMDVHSSLFAANQNAQNKLAKFREDTAHLKAMEKEFRGVPGWKESFAQGGDVKRQGVRYDGCAFWVMSTLGGTHEGGLIIEQLFNCETFAVTIQSGAKGTNLEGEVYVVVAMGKAGGPNGLVQESETDSKVEGAYKNLKDANKKLKYITAGYHAHLNRISHAYGWGDAYFYNGRASITTKKDDGTLVWAGMRNLKLSATAQDLGSIAVYKRTVDYIAIDAKGSSTETQD